MALLKNFRDLREQCGSVVGLLREEEGGYGGDDLISGEDHVVDEQQGDTYVEQEPTNNGDQGYVEEVDLEEQEGDGSYVEEQQEGQKVDQQDSYVDDQKAEVVEVEDTGDGYVEEGDALADEGAVEEEIPYGDEEEGNQGESGGRKRKGNRRRGNKRRRKNRNKNKNSEDVEDDSYADDEASAEAAQVVEEEEENGGGQKYDKVDVSAYTRSNNGEGEEEGKR